MTIDRFNSGLLNSSMYVISENGHAIVIDPCLNTEPANALNTDYILITHEHYDHIFGVNAWKEKTGAPLVCSEICAQRIKDPKKNQARHFDSFCKIQTLSDAWDLSFFNPAYSCEADSTFTGSIELVWQGHTVKIMEIPGHSPGSMGIWIDELFFSGDSLLEGKEIELRFPGGSKKQWEEYGKKIIDAIPEGTMVYPGHYGEFELRRG